MRLNIGRLAPLAIAACALVVPASASATSTKKQIKTSTAADVSFLESQQQPDGSFFTDWAIDSLGAAGVAAADVKPAGGSVDARSWYQGLIGDPSTWPGGSEPAVSEFERATLLSYAAGIDPARVSTRQNLIAQIVSRYQTANPGYYGPPSNFGGTLFALLALAETKTTNNKQRVPQTLLDQSVAVMKGNQRNDGGWAFEQAEGNPTRLAEPSEPDETGAAIGALCAAGVPTTDPSVAKGVAFLKGDLESSGAFGAEFGVNTDSNAFAIQGLDACGISPQEPGFTTTSGHTPLDFMISQQVGSGGFVFSTEFEETEANEYSSQDALRSLAGAGFTAAPRKPKSGAAKWAAASSFQSGVTSLLTLVVDNGTSALKACSVAIAPSGATTTLGAVLQAAETTAKPSGCVSSFLPTSGSGSLTQVNGAPSPAEAKWDVSIDGGTAKAAKLSSKVELGDTISLTLG
jgi:hypothetical protein